MSIATRRALVDHSNTVFQRQSQRDDLLDPNKTRTELIALLTYICITKDHPFEFTAIKTDHHDDSHLSADGTGTHARGYGADGWPLDNRHLRAGAYLEADDARFQRFLRDLANAPFLRQIGLAGEADTSYNRSAAGPTVFSDSGADHIHIGAQ